MAADKKKTGSPSLSGVRVLLLSLCGICVNKGVGNKKKVFC